MKTDTNIERLETIAGRRPQRHHLWASIGNADLKVAVCVFLLQNDSNGFFHVNEKTPRASDILLVMGHAPRSQMPVFLKGGLPFGPRIVAMKMGL